VKKKGGCCKPGTELKSYFSQEFFHIRVSFNFDRSQIFYGLAPPVCLPPEDVGTEVGGVNCLELPLVMKASVGVVLGGGGAGGLGGLGSVGPGGGLDGGVTNGSLQVQAGPQHLLPDGGEVIEVELGYAIGGLVVGGGPGIMGLTGLGGVGGLAVELEESF